MDEKSTWECDMMSRDKVPHPLVRHIAPQGDSDFLWGEAHERSYTVKANMRVAHVMSQPQYAAE